MCYNCGCFNPTDDMGHEHNITNQTQLKALSEHWKKSFEDTQKKLLEMLETKDANLEKDTFLKDMFEKAAHAWGQSVDEAKKNTQTLLKSEIK